MQQYSLSITYEIQFILSVSFRSSEDETWKFCKSGSQDDTKVLIVHTLTTVYQWQDAASIEIKLLDGHLDSLDMRETRLEDLIYAVGDTEKYTRGQLETYTKTMDEVRLIKFYCVRVNWFVSTVTVIFELLLQG